MISTQLTARSAVKQSGLAALMVVMFITLFAGRAQAYSQVVAFGDSLSDNGNLFAMTGGAVPPWPYYDGRFSDGPVWVETLAGNLGVSLDNRAVGGATTADIGGQIGVYVGGAVDPNALYTIWGGANDFLSLGPADDPFAAVGNAVTNLLTGVGTLMAAGAESFLVLNLPDLGVTPRAGDSPDGGAGATMITGAFNNALSLNLAATFPAADIAFMDTFSILADILADPAADGLTNTTDACFNATLMTLCGNPEEYVFWDDIHPTNKLHNMLAAEAQELVATNLVEPGTLGFALIGFIGVGWLRRKAA